MLLTRDMLVVGTAMLVAAMLYVLSFRELAASDPITLEIGVGGTISVIGHAPGGRPGFVG